MITRQGFDPWVIGLDPQVWAGDEVVCPCPFHNDRNPSLIFNVRIGLYFCFACGASGNANMLAKELGGTPVMTSIRVPEEQSYAIPWEKLLRVDLALDDDYLASRGVTNEQVEKFRIKRLGDKLIFPLQGFEGADEGVLIRNKEGRARYINYGYKPPIFPVVPFYQAQEKAMERGDYHPVLCEGIFGLLNLDKHGIPGGCLLGATPSKLVPRFLFYATIAFDDDQAGYVGASKLLHADLNGPDVQAVMPGLEVDEASEGVLRQVYEREIYYTGLSEELIKMVPQERREKLMGSIMKWASDIDFN